MGLCKAVLIGHLGKDPEMKYTQDGLAIANFNVAATEKVKGQDKTEWFRVTAFGKLGEICGQYLNKGKQVYVEGRIQKNEYVDKDGKAHFGIDVIASTVQMLGGKSEKAETQQSDSNYSSPVTQPSSQPPVPTPGVDDDIPF